MEHFSNTRGIKKIHQNIKGLLTNIGSLTLLLNTYKNIDIITLSETHITYGSWKDSSGLYAIPGFTFISKCCQNGEWGGAGIYVAENLKWKRREDLEDVRLEGIWIEIFHRKANSFIVGTVYRPPETSKYLPPNFKDIFNNNLVTVNNTNKK